MNKFKSVLRLLKNVQILSALLWAFTIIGCAAVSDKSNVSTILITAAGFHVILMSQLIKPKCNEKISA